MGKLQGQDQFSFCENKIAYDWYLFWYDTTSKGFLLAYLFSNQSNNEDVHVMYSSIANNMRSALAIYTEECM